VLLVVCLLIGLVANCRAVVLCFMRQLAVLLVVRRLGYPKREILFTQLSPLKLLCRRHVLTRRSCIKLPRCCHVLHAPTCCAAVMCLPVGLASSCCAVVMCFMRRSCIKLLRCLWCGGWVIRREKYSSLNYFRSSCCAAVMCLPVGLALLFLSSPSRLLSV